jgi:hypothetical protein
MSTLDEPIVYVATAIYDGVLDEIRVFQKREDACIWIIEQLTLENRPEELIREGIVGSALTDFPTTLKLDLGVLGFSLVGFSLEKLWDYQQKYDPKSIYDIEECELE